MMQFCQCQWHADLSEMLKYSLEISSEQEIQERE
jgi:hypothetical protein